MKKIYIPKGETVRHNNLNTDKLIVKGTLHVSGKIVAKEILGGGVIEAREIVCDDLHAYSVNADFITAVRVVADKLFVRFECRATEHIAVTGFIGAGYVSAGKLSMTLSDIASCDADEIITLPQRRRGIVGFLWASWWHSLFLGLFHQGQVNKTKNEFKKDTPSPLDVRDGDESQLLAGMLAALRTQGYQIRKIQDVDASADQEVAA